MQTPRILLSLTAAVCVTALPSVAQTAPSIRTLAQALDQVTWDTARRGALIAIDAPNVPLWTPKRAPEEPSTPPEPLPPPRFDGYRLNTIAPYFNRKVVTLDTLSVLVPPQMVILNTHPGAPDLLTGVKRDEKIQMLLASLSPAQWRLLGGEQGLGLGDLAREQQPVFLSLLPDPFRVQKVTVRAPSNGGYSLASTQSPTTLTAGQKAGVRLRMRRSTQVLVPMANQPNAFTALNQRYNQPVGTELLTLMYSSSDYSPRADPWGVPIKTEAPNRLKPGDLAFDAPALAVPVPLGAAKTVGDLVKQVGKTAHLELYADPRVATMPVWTRGAAARAGDVLKALCLAVTSTFRRVGPADDDSAAYLLTDDLVGIGARTALLADWAQDAQAAEQKQSTALQERIAAQQPAQYLSFSPADPFALSPERMRTMEEGWAKGRYDNGDLSLSSLPPAQQAAVREAAGRTPESVNADRVRLDVQMKLSYLVPGGGEIDDDYTGTRSLSEAFPRPKPPMPSLPPLPKGPVPFPTSLTERVLLVAPANPEEASRAAREAKTAGITELWVAVPQGGGDILTAAIAAGKEANLPVHAVARLLRTPTPAANDLLDIDSLGETFSAYRKRRAASPSSAAGDWLRVDKPAMVADLKQRLTALAATPGVAGLVLTDTVAPGYSDTGTSSASYAMPFDDSWDGGYSPETRLQFLRKEGIDPVDIIRFHPNQMDLDLPFFPDAKLQAPYVQVDEGRWEPDPKVTTLTQKWNAFRSTANLRLMTDLFATLKGTGSDARPLMISSRSDRFTGIEWYSSWDKADSLPQAPSSSGNLAAMLQMARAGHRRTLITLPWTQVMARMPLAGVSERDMFRLLIKLFTDEMAQQHAAPAGMVLDFGDTPVDKVLSLLNALRQ